MPITSALRGRDWRITVTIIFTINLSGYKVNMGESVSRKV